MNRLFIAEFDRLTGSNLSLKGSPIERAIDEASGRQKADLTKFIDFVYKHVWKPFLDANGAGEPPKTGLTV